MAGDASRADVQAILRSPEVQAAIGDMVATKVAEIQRQNPGVGKDTERLFSEMALAIAEMNHQGTGRPRPLAPEIMAKRLAAQAEMHKLLDEVSRNLKAAREAGDKKTIEKWLPRYRVVGKVFFNETMIEPFRRPERRGDRPTPTIITWSGAPNDFLIPVNDIALRLKNLYRESIGMAPALKPVSGPNGGQAVQDRRGYWMTIEGHVVKGEAPPGGVALDTSEDLEAVPMSRDSLDPNAPFVHVLGTVSQPARQGAQSTAQPTAAELAAM